MTQTYAVNPDACRPRGREGSRHDPLPTARSVLRSSTAPSRHGSPTQQWSEVSTYGAALLR
jgi:hypothetical protein